MAAFDYIIVGGGAAGCVLANRLTANEKTRVLLLEAGGRDDNVSLRLPLGVGKVWRDPRYNWSFQSEPEPFADGRRLFHPRGKVLGGSSSINMMSYVRGHRRDYDRWQEKGATGWSFQDLLPYFRRAETYDAPSPYRGKNGPLQVTLNTAPDEVYEAFLNAGVELGYPRQEDYNGPEHEGFARMQQMVRGGRRSSAASAYLRPALGRPNLEVRVRARVVRIVFAASRAVGVEYISADGMQVIVNAAEVLMSAGAFGTPHLLQLSGLGPAAELKKIGIKPLVDLPGVGSNLHDHPQVNVILRRRGMSRMQRELRLDRLALNVARCELFGSGFGAEAPGGVTAFVRSSPSESIPDLELFCVPTSLGTRPWFPLMRRPLPDEITLKVALLRPKATGRVWAASADPMQAPRILTNFLGSEADRRALREGVRICRAIGATHAFKSLVETELAPKVGVLSDQDIDAFVRRGVETIFHPCGTCRIGADEDAVVDTDLRVRGVDGLHIVDASVMPDNVGATINAPVLAIAERAADLLLGKIVSKAREITVAH
jgi:4-pyridoxate dehydrogenase